MIRKYFDPAVPDVASGADATNVVLKAFDAKFDKAATKEQVQAIKDELTKAIEGAATKADLDKIAGEVTVTKDLAEKLNEKLGQINAAKPNQKVGDVILDAIMEKVDDIRKAMATRNSTMRVETKAAVTMDFATNFSDADHSITTVKPGIVGLPNRKTHLRQLLSGGTMSNNKIFSYVAETGGEGAPALWTNYGTAKAKIDRDFEERDAPVRDIAGYLKISKSMLEDPEGMRSFLQNRLLEMYLDVEDYTILYGPNDTLPNLTGLTVAATGSVSAAARTIDRIALTMAGLESNNYSPNGILVNPVTYMEMVLNQATDKSYSYPVVFNAVNGQLTLAGVPVFKHPEMLVGKFLVGDWTNGAQLITRQSPTIEFANQNEDDFIKNLITIRVEGRIALPIYYPAGWSYGDKGVFSGS